MNDDDTNFVDHELMAKIKQEFLSLYSKMEKILSSKYLEDFLLILEANNVSVKTDNAINYCKTLLVEKLSKLFCEMWEFENIPQNLSALEILKDQYSGKKGPLWRPFGKTPNEQTLPLRVRMLKRKESFFEQQFNFQKDKLETAISTVEANRKLIHDLNQRREYLAFQLSLRLESLPGLKKDLDDLQKVAELL